VGYKLASNKPVYRGQAQAGNAIYIEPGMPLRVGRGKEAEYQIADGRISRVHCILLLKGGKLSIEDKGSSNGTFVNGKQVKASQLEDGDEVVIGDAKLRVEAYDEAASKPKAAKVDTTAKKAAEDAEATKIIPPQERKCESCGAGISLAAGGSAYCAKCTDPLLGTTVGEYRIVRPLATGDASMVYRAEAVATKAPFALKVLKPEVVKNAAIVERLRKAGELGRQLDHPNHVRVHATGDLGGRPYLVLDLAPGEPAEALIGPGKRVDTDRAAAIGLQVAAALAFAERHGASHGDLTPSQVIIASTGDARVLGFGTCPWSAEAAQRDGVALGRLICYLLSGKMPTSANPAAEAAQLLSAQPKGLIDAAVRLLSPPAGGAASSRIETLLDLLPFALRKKGRLGLPTSIRAFESLDLLAPSEAGGPAEARISSVLRARLVPTRLESPAGYSIVVATRTAAAYPRDCVQLVLQPQGGVVVLLASSVQAGLSGSVLLASLQAACHALGLLTVRPAQLLDKCSEKMRTDPKEGLRINAIGVLIDPVKDELHTSMAGGQGFVLWSGPRAEFTAVRGEGGALGAQGSTPSPNQTLHIEVGDRILIPGDGLIGAKNAKGTMFGFERTLQVLRSAGKTFAEQSEALFKAAAEFRGPSTLSGDMTLVAIDRAETE